MIKKLIFDLDNTLIMWRKEYNIAVQKAFEMLNLKYSQEMVDIINNLTDSFENDFDNPHRYYNKKVFLEYINKKTNYNLNINFLNSWLKCNIIYSTPDKLDKTVYDTLEYLSKKYELVVLTNWFSDAQIGRMEKAGIKKYFSHIYTAEKYAKPKKEAFLQAVEKNNLNECVMIGDNLIIDILGARDTGITNLIWINNNNKKDDYKDILKNIKVITNLNELKNIF